MTTLADVSQGLADAVAVTGLPCAPFPAETINAPCAQVAWQSFDPRTVLSERKTAYQFIVGVFVTSAVTASAFRLLSGYADMSGDTSITGAIQNSANWPNVTVDYAVVTNISAPAWVEIGGANYASIQLTVEVVW